LQISRRQRGLLQARATWCVTWPWCASCVDIRSCRLLILPPRSDATLPRSRTIELAFPHRPVYRLTLKTPAIHRTGARPMKISFMTFACPEYDIKQVLAAATEFGYHGVEFRTDANHSHGVELSAINGERKSIRAALDSEAIEACCLATSLQFATERVMDEVQPRIDLAHDIGCPALRVF